VQRRSGFRGDMRGILGAFRRDRHSWRFFVFFSFPNSEAHEDMREIGRRLARHDTHDLPFFFNL
jgi:hypothetical protein